MDKGAGDVRQLPKSTKPPSEKEETRGKLKPGKIVRIIPMGVPFSPKQFQEICELSKKRPRQQNPQILKDK